MTKTLPVLGIAHAVLFPGMRCSVALVNARARAAVDEALESASAEFAVVAARPGSFLDPDPHELFDVGTLAAIHAVVHRPCCGRLVADIETRERVRVVAWTRDVPFREASCEVLVDPDEDRVQLRQLAQAIVDATRQLHSLFPTCRHTLRSVAAARAAQGPEAFPGVVSELLQHIPLPELQALLERSPLSARLEATLAELRTRLAHSGDPMGPPTFH